MDTPLPIGSIIKYSTWTCYHPALTIRMHQSTCSQPYSRRSPCDAHFRDYFKSNLGKMCSSLHNTLFPSQPQLNSGLPAEGAACKKAEKSRSIWAFKLLQTWNQWSPTFQEICLTPELRSKSINPTSASDNQWTWLAGSAQLGLDWKWNLSEGIELHGDHWAEVVLIYFSFDFSHHWE